MPRPSRTPAAHRIDGLPTVFEVFQCCAPRQQLKRKALGGVITVSTCQKPQIAVRYSETHLATLLDDIPIEQYISLEVASCFRPG